MKDRPPTKPAEKQPLYQQVVDDILATISGGAFSYDQPLCTESSLMERYGFSRITVRRALAELEAKGVLYRKRGVGSFVSNDLYTEESPRPLPLSSKLFAFILPFNISRTGLTDAFQAANEELLANGCYASVYISEDDGDKKGRMILDRLLGMDVAGVAYYPRTGNIHLDRLNAFVFNGRPVVVMDVPSGSPYIPSVTSDNLSGSTLLMEHLLDLGHRKIAYISGVSPSARATVGDRLAGYVLAHSKAGLPLTPQFIRTDVSEEARVASVSNPGSLRAVLDNLVRLGVTAVIAEHDGIAYDILLCCRELGIDVPGQLSVCGFDNSEWATALGNSKPPMRLTTIAQDQAAIGRTVARLLYEGVSQPIQRCSPVVIPVTFIQGNTTGRAPQKPL